MNWEELCEKAAKKLEGEPKLIRLPSRGRAIFVGDTHGDLDATKKVLRRYLKPSYRIVFLGDYVDRGEQSEENLQLLLETKLERRRWRKRRPSSAWARGWRSSAVVRCRAQAFPR